MDKCSICPSNGRISTPVSYVVFEAGMARLERTNKRVIVALILTILMLFASNVAWLYAWMQYDYTVESTETKISVDAKDGVANYIGNDGDIVNGEDISPQNDD